MGRRTTRTARTTRTTRTTAAVVVANTKAEEGAEKTQATIHKGRKKKAKKRVLAAGEQQNNKSKRTVCDRWRTRFMVLRRALATMRPMGIISSGSGSRS